MSRKFIFSRHPALMSALVMLATFLAVGTARPAAAAPADTASENAALAYWQAFAAVPTSEAQVAIIDAWASAPLDNAAEELIDSSTYALSELRRGARMSRCDWGMDYTRGPELLMPHLAKGRQLARLAMLRARHRFEQGNPRDGVVDALSAMKLGHDIGADPILIAILVQYGLEGMSMDLLARHLPKLSPEQLDELAKTLDKLPSGDQVKQVWGTETRFMVDWFEERLKKAAEGGEGDWSERVLSMPIFGEEERAKLKAAAMPPLPQMLEQLESIRAYYRELEKLTDLPPAEQDARVAALKKSVTADNTLFHILAPSVDHVFQVRRRTQAQRAMLRAAIAVQRDGPERLKDKALADPFGEAPFEHRKIERGFELQSKLVHRGKAVTLIVGDPVKQ